MKPCFLCLQPACQPLIDFGRQPLCHHFYDGQAAEDFFPMVLGQCQACGVVQLITAVPPQDLVPRVDWIVYNEPEWHLDAVVKSLCELPGITPQSAICGLSYKEDSTLKRFNQLGYANTWRADNREDLGITDSKAGVEMLQQSVQPPLVARLKSKYGAPDIAIVRHVLEHTHDTSRFMAALRQLVKPNGYVVFEIPDCARGFDLLDYTTLWEDHTLYFVEKTFLMCLQRGGFKIARFDRYRAPYENCLVAIVQPNEGGPTGALSAEDLAIGKKQVIGFANGFEQRRKDVRQLLTDWRKKGKIAMFGAGHQSAMFINLFGLGDLIEFVLDDHPRKMGQQMPGSRLPIVESARLSDPEIKLCLLSLGVDSEKKVVEKKKNFIEQGGTFASIFPVQENALLNFITV